MEAAASMDANCDLAKARWDYRLKKILISWSGICCFRGSLTFKDFSM